MSTESAWPQRSCGVHGSWQSRGTVLPWGDPGEGISSPTNPPGALTASARAPEHTWTNKQPCTLSPVHTHRSQHIPAVPPARAGPSLGAGISIPLRSGFLCPPCTAFTDSLQTVSGAQVRSIKQRAAARAGDSNNKSCSVQWLKLVFKKYPEKKLTPPKTRVGPIAANNQQD